jgi:ParB-like chromosome segregation protein Spo0J
VSARLREFEVHPLAELFPLVGGAEYEDLRTSVRENGVINRVALYRGQLLDGRNRVRAAMAEGRPVPTYDLPDDADPVAFVLSQNIARRHLTPHDRAALTVKVMEVSGELAKAKEEAAEAKKRKPALLSVSGETNRIRQVVAARAGVSPATAQRVLDEQKADPEAFDESTVAAMKKARTTRSPHPVIPRKKRITRVRKTAKFLTHAPSNVVALAAYIRQRFTSPNVDKLARLLRGEP